MSKSCIGVVILNYNNVKDTIACIQSIEKYNTAVIKYIIIDNGSTLPNVVSDLNCFLTATFQEKYQQINLSDKKSIKLLYANLLVSSSNDGYAQGNNKGLQLAYQDEEISDILILNNDVLFVENILPALSLYYNQLKNVAILSPILYKKGLKELDYNCARKNISPWAEIGNNFLHYFFKLFNIPSFGGNRYILKNEVPTGEIIPIELPSGSCMYINKNLFQEIGSFDSNTFLYWEENILFKKTEMIHKQNYLCTDLKCIHLGASSTASSPSLFIIDCNLRSSRYYMKKYSGCSLVTLWIHYISTIFYKYTFILQKKLQKRNYNS